MKKSKPPLFRAAHLSCLAVLLTLGVIVANVDSGSKSEVKVVKDGSLVRVTWPISGDETGSVVFSMDETQPLIETMAVGEKVIASALNPATVLTVGSRDLNDAAGWVAFFDNPRKREYHRYPVKLGKRIMKAETAVITFAALLQHRFGDLV